MNEEESSVNSVDIDAKIAAFILKKRGLDVNDVKPEYTDLKIITHVAKANLGVNLNLNIVSKYLYSILEHNKKYGIDTNLRGVDYMGTKLILDEKAKKVKKRKDKNDGKKERQHGFTSACTIIIRTSNVDGLQRIVNFKLFNNDKGSISMTGLEYTNSGVVALEYFLNLIGKTSKFYKNEGDWNKIAINDYQIVNVVSMIRTNFKIDPINLDDILKNKYGILSSWDSSRYSAVYVSYIANDINKSKDGLCHCKTPCVEKEYSGNGIGDGNCKRITISVFQKGCIMISGACSLEQTHDSHQFIVGVLRDNYNDVRKMIINDL